MKNYMEYINKSIQNIEVTTNDGKKIIYDLSSSNFITDYKINGDKVIVYYGDGSVQKYPNNERVINFLEYQLSLQVEKVAKFYQNNLINSKPSLPKEILLVTGALVLYEFLNDPLFEKLYYLTSPHPNISYQITLAMMACGVIILPKLAGLMEEEEIISYAQKIDYFQSHQEQLKKYFGKNNNDTIIEVEALSLKKLKKIVKENQK